MSKLKQFKGIVTKENRYELLNSSDIDERKAAIKYGNFTYDELVTVLKDPNSYDLLRLDVNKQLRKIMRDEPKKLKCLVCNDSVKVEFYPRRSIVIGSWTMEKPKYWDEDLLVYLPYNIFVKNAENKWEKVFEVYNDDSEILYKLSLIFGDILKSCFGTDVDKVALKNTSSIKDLRVFDLKTKSIGADWFGCKDRHDTHKIDENTVYNVFVTRNSFNHFGEKSSIIDKNKTVRLQLSIDDIRKLHKTLVEYLNCCMKYSQ